MRPGDGICVGKLTIIASDNGLSPGRRQAIIWTNAGILLIGPLGTNFSEILIAIETFSFQKNHLKMSSGKCRPFCLGLNVLTSTPKYTYLRLMFCQKYSNDTKPVFHSAHTLIYDFRFEPCSYVVRIYFVNFSSLQTLFCNQFNESPDALPSHGYGCFTHWRREKMTAIFQTTFSHAFSWMKMYEFWSKFHWSLFVWVDILTTNKFHWFVIYILNLYIKYCHLTQKYFANVSTTISLPSI